MSKHTIRVLRTGLGVSAELVGTGLHAEGATRSEALGELVRLAATALDIEIVTVPRDIPFGPTLTPEPGERR